MAESSFPVFWLSQEKVCSVINLGRFCEQRSCDIPMVFLGLFSGIFINGY
jgi:hypothetical protein